jgi:oligosaccharide repeat unit polymerase
MLKILKNPFYIYPVSFGIVFALYALDWSDAFPKITATTSIFFICTFFISIVFGDSVDKLKYIGYSKIQGGKPSKEFMAIAFILLGVFIEILYEGGSPLISAIKGERGVFYKDFGIKFFHVVLVSYNSFLTVYMFHMFLSTKKKKHLIYYLITYVPPLLIFNRGMIILGLVSSFFVFISSQKRTLNFKQIFFLLVSGITALYSFGVLGNIRLANGDERYILNVSGASKTFDESKIPKEFFWTYLYGASPLANFQENINKTETVDYNFFELAVSEMTPDVLSKRIKPIFQLDEKIKSHRTRDFLTVGTVFMNSYSIAKWFGPIILYIYSIFLLFLIFGLVPKKSKYHVSSIAILSTLILMNTFSNMFVFSGIILQLIYPIVFAYFENKKLVIK